MSEIFSYVHQHDETYDEEEGLPELTGSPTFEDGDFIDEDRWEEFYDY